MAKAQRQKEEDPVIVNCPNCGVTVELDTEDLEEGECVVCDQCDEALTVVSVSPLELEVEEDDEDDDLEEEDGIDDEDDDDDLEVEDDFEDDEDNS